MYRKNAWEKYEDKKPIMDFAEGYKKFISIGKTERLVAKEAIAALEAKGFKKAEGLKGVKPGDKIYFVNKNKNVCAYVVGKKPLIEGLRILGAHIDSPRLDLKEHPIYEDKGFALGDTHYYGGVKKYQWVTIPLALHGVICKKDGTVAEVSIGEDPADPVVGITDLLIHLAQDQLQKPGAKVIEGEGLDISLGSIPLKDAEKEPVKANILAILKEKYDVEEEDLISAEIEVTPAGPARDYGLDRSMVAGYGHDDRVCAYTSLQAILDIEDPEFTSCCILVDKEEIGSVGATGAQSLFFENTIAQLALASGEKNPMLAARIIMENSKMLSSDVSAGFDPLYPQVNDPKNAAYFGQGLVFNKYTGRGGKGGSNDANPEFMARIRRVLDEDDVVFQTSELGKVDVGGGGTIAYIMANYGMEVIDCGIAILNMHAPYEIASKADIYEAVRAYTAFLRKMENVK